MSKGIRQFHRWVSIVFTLTVLANIVQVTMRPGQPPNLLTYSPLPFLAVLMLTGLYLFFLPYRTKRRAAPRAD